MIALALELCYVQMRIHYAPIVRHSHYDGIFMAEHG